MQWVLAAMLLCERRDARVENTILLRSETYAWDQAISIALGLFATAQVPVLRMSRNHIGRLSKLASLDYRDELIQSILVLIPAIRVQRCRGNFAGPRAVILIAISSHPNIIVVRPLPRAWASTTLKYHVAAREDFCGQRRRVQERLRGTIEAVRWELGTLPDREVGKVRKCAQLSEVIVPSGGIIPGLGIGDTSQAPVMVV